MIALSGTLNLPQIDPNTVERIIDNAMHVAGVRVAGLVLREAKANAPVSPTQAEINAERESRKKKTTRKATASARKPTKAKNRPMPGGLERSIATAVEASEKGGIRVAVFVRDPSEASKYADYIHNQKGVKWHNRGIGTRNKGERADEKFIERAVYDNERYWYECFKKAAFDAVKT